MKFIMCEAPPRSTARQKEFQWLYVCEGRVAVGDIVHASFGYDGQQYMEVIAVGTTRKAVGSEYRGAVKVVEKPVSAEEAQAVRRVWKSEQSLANARAALRRVRNEFTGAKEANLKYLYGNVKVSAPRRRNRPFGLDVEPSLRHYGG